MQCCTFVPPRGTLEPTSEVARNDLEPTSSLPRKRLEPTSVVPRNDLRAPLVRETRASHRASTGGDHFILRRRAHFTDHGTNTTRCSHLARGRSIKWQPTVEVISSLPYTTPYKIEPPTSLPRGVSRYLEPTFSLPGRLSSFGRA